MTIGTKGQTSPTGKDPRWEVWVTTKKKGLICMGFYYDRFFAENAVDVLNRMAGITAHLKPMDINEPRKE